MGVGLVSKYRFTTEDKLIDLQNDFRRQIEKYLPQLQGIDIYVYLENKVCYINATINDILYTFVYDTDKNSLNSVYHKISDL